MPAAMDESKACCAMLDAMPPTRMSNPISRTAISTRAPACAELTPAAISKPVTGCCEGGRGPTIRKSYYAQPESTNATFSSKLAETLKGNVMRSAAVVLVALVVAACGNSSTGPGAGFECLGKPLPTTAPSTILVSGQLTYNALQPTALQSAGVAAIKASDTTMVLDTTTSDGSGH